MLKLVDPLDILAKDDPRSSAPSAPNQTVAQPTVRAPIFVEIPAKSQTPLAPLGSLGRSFKNRHNNLLLVRLFLSLTVVFSHSFALANGPDPGDVLKRLTSAYWNSTGITIGFSAVDLFFVVSGFLVTHSFVRSPSVLDFARKRFWRIWPAYIIAGLMCLLVIGPLALNQWPAVPYSVWPMYFLDVLLLRNYQIDGIFADNPFRVLGNGILNGSMWTIKYEVMCYVFIALCWAVGALRRRHVIGTLFLVAASYYGLQVSGMLANTRFEPWLPRGLAFFVGEALEWPRMITCYLAGMTLYVYRDVLPHRWWAAAISVAALIAAGLVNSWLMLPLIPLLLGYAALSIGFTTSGRSFTSRIDRYDLSYGVYLYAFPIQQCVVHFLPIVRGNPLLLFSITYPTVLLIAFLSMRFIEQRFFAKKVVHPGCA